MKKLLQPRNLFCLFLLLGTLSAPCAWAKEKNPGKKSASIKRTPIEMKMGINPLGASVGYFLEGKNINHYRNFREVMEPQGDPETLKLIRGAEDADKWSWGFMVSGLALGIVTAITVPPSPLLGIDILDRAATGGFYAQFLVLPGAVFQIVAEGDKFNAVQRYNRLARGEKEVGLGLQPQLFANRDHLGLGLNCRF